MILAQRTIIPSHILRSAAWAESGSDLDKNTWLEQQWHRFCRATNTKRRTGIVQAEFDKFLRKQAP